MRLVPRRGRHWRNRSRILQRATLRHAADDRSLVNIVRNGIPGTEMPSFAIALTDRKAWQTAAYVRSLGRIATRPLPGDARRGAALYRILRLRLVPHRQRPRRRARTRADRRRCAARRDRICAMSLVNPAATHPPGYLVVRAVTTNGAEIRGIRVNEDVFWIHIRDAGGTVHVLEKSDLSRARSRAGGDADAVVRVAVSPPAELDDLVAYLATSSRSNMRRLRGQLRAAVLVAAALAPCVAQAAVAPCKQCAPTTATG